MKLCEITSSHFDQLLFEEGVESTWIEDLTYDDDEGSVWMTTLSGGQYEIPEVPYEVYEQWINAESKGKFWWEYVRGIYTQV